MGGLEITERVIKIVLNVKVCKDMLVFDSNEIVLKLLSDFIKFCDGNHIKIQVKDGAVEALYLVLACTNFKINVY